ncbi:MAG: hypothetical protein KatS3mg031_0328 [Chitinophagales bacterium]|nr:MAG: hypothetical protein KatS3mg031_0328 [Chitinophagales bacterium]
MKDTRRQLSDKDRAIEIIATAFCAVLLLAIYLKVVFL